MRQFLSHLRHHSKSSALHTDPLNNLPESFYREQEIFRFRKQRGVNLGSWFVLERWIADGPFRLAVQPAQSDLDVALGKDAKYILEDHWNNWITETDWKWIKERGFNAVRIPIGYYHLAGLDPSLLEGTDFRDCKDVFTSAWAKIQEAFERAYKYGIGVLIDLHAAPGKQSADFHSGTSKQPTFFSSKHNMQHTTHILSTLLSRLNQFLHSHSPPLPNLIGIELINEPDPPSDTSLQTWYATSIQKLRSIDSTIPIYIGEYWRLDAYSDWLVQSHAGGDALMVLDHHLYRCFTSSDINAPAADHTRVLEPETKGQTADHFTSLSEKLGLVPGGSGIVIGEWSGAFNPGSLRTSSSGGWEETKQFIDTQIRLYDRTCAGFFFWTFKKQHPGDFGWSLRDAVGSGTFPDRIGLRLTIPGRVIEPEDISRAKPAIMKVACENHRKWWSQFPGNYEHWKFDDGFSNGWDEALRFLMFNLSGNNSLTELGFPRARARSQTEDHGSSYWEYEHGFIQAVDEARNFFRNDLGYA